MRIRLKPAREQVIVITGASSGIGLATARLAALRGARLVLTARNEATLESIANDLRSRTEVEVVRADVGVEAEVNAVAEAARRRFGGFDTWVNNAGVSIYGEVTEVSVEDQRRLFETNFWGVVHGSRAALSVLRDRGGAIINIGSILSDRAIPLQGAYCASKHAVKGWTDTLRMELEHAEVPVSVTLIKPSAITTPYVEGAKNLMDEEPALPPPLYAPELVAEAILYAAENQTRDFVVGGGGYMIALMGNLMPRLTDRVMERTMWSIQKSGEDKEQRANNLYRPTSKGLARGGPHPGSGREVSLFSALQMHQRAVGLGLAGAAGLVGLLALAAEVMRPSTPARRFSRTVSRARRTWL
jgi:short-subunit dehydrogenase